MMEIQSKAGKNPKKLMGIAPLHVAASKGHLSKKQNKNDICAQFVITAVQQMLT